ncbi:hypothetical protein J5226_22760 [Lysobacter sp. K5869]|uniref:hypothetical protein n=1 Tax=Lysobacter sp. K5869 TaxID=2820808 RepID=UPI001C063541|nr:hypothetical protein [Lysobacter sp. K5869]QWP76372.1 hypothetical protein J5226_22760 [Lysobacter sp. K5869]
MALDIGTEFLLRQVFDGVLVGLGKLLRGPLYWTGWMLLYPQLRKKPPQHPLFCWAGVAFWLVFAGVCAAAYWYLRNAPV